MKMELLSPAGSLDCFFQALYNGADAVYLATERFGARAYAKNLSHDELKTALAYAHASNVKIYVTVNTIIKESELADAKAYLYELYKMGVDGVIVADYALVNYIKNYLKPMECHISTQAGIKDLNDVKFFESLGVDRCVIAREVPLAEIRKIKSESRMPIEVFGYGALCVCYSGGCLFSSFLSLRSGNRGRCSQNCRREYKLYKNGELMDEGFLLSMKDLNSYPRVNELLEAGVDSLKIEGRMKSADYVKLVTSEYRKKIDNFNYKSNALDTVFHRAYTKGFLFNEDRANVVDKSKKNNEGALIGSISGFNGMYTKVNIERSLSVGDRIRIESENDYFFTIDKMYNLNGKEIKSANGTPVLLNIYEKQKVGSKVYKMIDSTIDLSIDTTQKCPLDITVYGSLGEPMTISCMIHDQYFEAKSDMMLDKAKTQGLDYNAVYKQLSKLGDTPFYLNEMNFFLEEGLFMTVSEINNTRRKLANQFMEYLQGVRPEKEITEIFKGIEKLPEKEVMLCAFCVTKDQADACKEMGIETIYYGDNYSAYVDSEYKNTDKDYVLVGNYGGLYQYKGKEIIADYSFNAINSEAVKRLCEAGASYVTLSLETDKDLIREIAEGYQKKFGAPAPLELIAYGHTNLMTTKYCPLRGKGECGHCNENKYTLSDSYGTFDIYHVKCVTHIVNGKATNLIDDIDYLTKYAKRIRLNFTVESKEETLDILSDYLDKLDGEEEKKFDAANETRGYFKRPIM